MDKNWRNTISGNRSNSSRFSPPRPITSISVSGNNQVQQAMVHNFATQLRQNIQYFWRDREADISNTVIVPGVNELPLTRIKKVMKSVQDVEMVSAESPLLFAKICEMFIMELALRAWMHTEQNGRRTLQRCDIAHAIRDDKSLSFLKNIVLMEDREIMPMEIVNQDNRVLAPLQESVAIPTCPSFTDQEPTLPSSLEVGSGSHLPYPINYELITPPPGFEVGSGSHLTYPLNDELITLPAAGFEVGSGSQFTYSMNEKYNLAPPTCFQTGSDELAPLPPEYQMESITGSSYWTYPMNQELAQQPAGFQVATDPHWTYPTNQEFEFAPQPGSQVANDPNWTYPTNQEFASQPGFQVANDPNLTYSMNSHDYMMESEETMLGVSPWFSPLPPPFDGSNGYPGFK